MMEKVQCPICKEMYNPNGILKKYHQKKLCSKKIEKKVKKKH